MKQAFQILKERPQITVVLTRDSVCAGDDCDAPHEKTIRIQSFVDPETLVKEASSGYLPTVAGVGHSWTCFLNDIKIAEIRTTGVESLVQDTRFDEHNRIHFVYNSARY